MGCGVWGVGCECEVECGVQSVYWLLLVSVCTQSTDEHIFVWVPTDKPLHFSMKKHKILYCHTKPLLFIMEKSINLYESTTFFIQKSKDSLLAKTANKRPPTKDLYFLFTLSPYMHIHIHITHIHIIHIHTTHTHIHMCACVRAYVCISVYVYGGGTNRTRLGVGGPDKVILSGLTVGPDAALIGPEAPLIGPDTAPIRPDAALIRPDTPSIRSDAALIGPDAPPIRLDVALIRPDTPPIRPDTPPPWNGQWACWWVLVGHRWK